jgi:hypothetical protein
MTFEAPLTRKLRRFRPMTADLEGRCPVSSLIPGFSPATSGVPQQVDSPGVENVPVETQPREMKLAAVATVAPLPSIGDPVVLMTSGRGDRFSSPSAGTLDSQPRDSSNMNDIAVDPISAMTGSGAGSLSNETPVLAPPASQPQARAGAVNGITHPSAPMPSPQPTVPNASAGTIRPMSMAPTNSAATSALTAAVASAARAEQAGPTVRRLLPPGHGTGIRPMASGGSGGGPTDAQKYPAFLHVSGGTLVGGSAGGEVSDVDNCCIQSVTWTVSGAVNQNYSPASGSTTAFPSPVTQTFSYNGQPTISTLAWCWNTQVGAHTVSVLVTYDDGSTTSDSQAVNVVQPTVNAFSISVAPATLAADDGVTNGMVTLQSPGIQYSATVSVPANTEGGVFGFLQVISANESCTNNVVHTFSCGWVLDNMGTTGNFYLIQGLTFSAPAGATTTSGPAQDDAPVAASYRKTDTSGVCTAYNGQTQFQTYLVFQPAGGGVWVELAQSAPYSLSGSATWNGTQFNGSSSLSSASPATSNALGFVGWTDYWTDPAISDQNSNWKPPY